MALYFPYGMGQLREMLVSLKRIQAFLLLEERSTDDDHDEQQQQEHPGSMRTGDIMNDTLLRIIDAQASWMPITASSDVS